MLKPKDRAKIFTDCSGPASQSIERDRISRQEGALDVRESRKRREKIAPVFLPERQEKRNFGLMFFHIFEQDRLLFAIGVLN